MRMTTLKEQMIKHVPGRAAQGQAAALGTTKRKSGRINSDLLPAVTLGRQDETNLSGVAISKAALISQRRGRLDLRDTESFQGSDCAAGAGKCTANSVFSELSRTELYCGLHGYCS